jgi:hypothetical protein
MIVQITLHCKRECTNVTLEWFNTVMLKYMSCDESFRVGGIVTLVTNVFGSVWIFSRHAFASFAMAYHRDKVVGKETIAVCACVANVS